ncbi:MAG: Rpn family recombination-promoting nuclease/putative transposase [Desulfamplus sp.]|nr:Rpn family recombination-promoting nuclease/putative transposase [Desulfamplus sp.]
MTSKQDKNDNNQHDTGYKFLFSHPELVKDLLTGFVKEDWVWEIDLNTFESVNTSFVTDDLRERFDDKIWRVRFRDKWLYLYLLLEFQSSDDYFMAVRIMTYIGLLYQDIIRSHGLKKGDMLPPVVPIVIYNGKSPWKSPCEIRELINPVHKSLKKFTPQISYWLLDEGRVGAENLEEFTGSGFNLTAELIAFELCKTTEEIRKHIARLHENLKSPENQAIRRTFAMWLSRLLRSRLKNDNIPEFQELKEVDSMLAETITEWTEQWKAEGIAKGRAEGKAEGEIKGRIKEKFNMIKRLYNFNMPLEQIAVIVNLSIDKIKKILEAGEKGIELIQEQDLM